MALRKRGQTNYIPTTIGIIASIAVVVAILSRQYIIQQAEIRVRDVLLESTSLHHYVQENMHPAMYTLKQEGRMPENFYSPEILSSSYISRHVFKHFNEDRIKQNLPMIQYRMAANNPRNLVNKANEFELGILEMFNNDSSQTKYSDIITENGVKYLYYAQPFLRVENKCLKCHGDITTAPYELKEYYHWESGFNWKIGDIPAIEIIKTPLVGEIKASTKIIVFILSTAILILILIILNSRLRISNQKRLEEKLRVEKRYQKLFNNSNDPILILNFEGSIIEANQNAFDMLGYLKETVIGRSLSDFYDKKNAGEIKNHLSRIITNDKYLYETTFVTKERNEIPCEINASVTQLNSKKAILATIRDITERKQHEKELNEHKKNLEIKVEERTDELVQTISKLKSTQTQLVHNEKMASLGVLTAGVAHEINNPLNYIMGAYIGLHEYFSENDSRKTDSISLMLSSLKTGVDRAAEIVQGLNLFSRESKDLNEVCDIHSILDNCLTMLHNQLKHRITISKEYCKEGLVTKGNVGSLHQVFLNVLTNAYQAIEDKGEITIFTKIVDNTAFVGIGDNGVGISEDNLKHVTEPFFTTKAPGKGTGLGLSISYSILKEHEGEISFKPNKKQGVLVEIKLPLI